MAAIKALAAGLLLSITPAFAQQQPLNLVQPQAQQAYAGTHRKLVDSEALQSKISGDKLLARAEDLYKLAELSYHDYHRPTRVIGSAGQFTLPV